MEIKVIPMEYDEFGPEKILRVYDPKTKMHGFTVIDNTVLGPGKGGIRMTPSVSIEEVTRLARAMTWKCSLAGLHFGGGKSGIIANDKIITPKQKTLLVKAFAKKIACIAGTEYVAAPDMNMAEKEMKIISTTLKNKKACTGKPRSLGGIPHEIGSTGWGVFESAKIAAKKSKLKNIKGASVAIEGFGNVGWFAAKYLSEAGANIVAVSDSKGVIYNKKGLDFETLANVKKKQGTVIKYADGKVMKNNEIKYLNADMLITAAIPDLIKEKDVNKLKYKVIVEGSNIPMKHDVEYHARTRGILIVPDFVANAGGVISSYVEFKGGKEKDVFPLVSKLIKKNTTHVLDISKKKKVAPRKAAMFLAMQRIEKKARMPLTKTMNSIL